MAMQGWVIPPPKEPTKSREDFREEREKKVRLLVRHGWVDRVDRARLRQALNERSGLPVAIERDRTIETASN